MPAIPNCLYRYIGIRAECDIAGIASLFSGLYIEDLPGITVDLAAQVTESQFNSGVSYLREKINMGINLVIDDFKKYASPYFTFKSSLHLTYPGNFNALYYPLEPLAGANRGLRITLLKDYPCPTCLPNPCVNCAAGEYTLMNMQRIKITRIKLLANNNAGPMSLFIKDGNDITSYVFNLNANQETELITEFVSRTPVVEIYMDNSLIEVNQGSIIPQYYKAGCGSCGTSGQLVKIQGVDFVTGNISNALHGILPEIEVTCDDEVLICGLADKLKFLFLYRAGIEIVKGWLYSGRYNSKTIIQAEKAEMMLEDFQKEYDDRYKALQFSIKDVLKDFDGRCIDCRGIKYGYSR